jgi:hypothetical protein
LKGSIEVHLTPPDHESKAAAIPITLWFDNLQDLQKLIGCGECSICYNLIDYILRRYGQQKSKYSVWVKELFDRRIEDWNKFEGNPMMMAKGSRLCKK